ncbi:MAG: hypothetical protein HN348_04840 [Proteobacteria bacterium]|jgi:hypothetical protein|nr:hypothetical protein [Pseudomonadota bacterium]
MGRGSTFYVLTAAIFLATALACGNIPQGKTFSHIDCDCQIKAPFGYTKMDSLVDQPAATFGSSLREQYVVVE